MTIKQVRIGALISPQLIAGLQRIYPNTVPAITANDRTIWASVGQQEVIAYMQREMDAAMQPPDADEEEGF